MDVFDYYIFRQTHVDKYNNYNDIDCPLCRHPILPSKCKDITRLIIFEDVYLS